MKLATPPDARRTRGRSWWLHDIQHLQASTPPLIPLMGSQSADIAIVGGGFAGMWTAIALLERKPSLSIAILEAHHCGYGASSRNGGKVHGYWSSLGRLCQQLGESDALLAARLGDRAQSKLRTFCTFGTRDCEWREGGNLLISTSEGQDPKISAALAVAKALRVSESVLALSPDEMKRYLKSPIFRGGLWYQEGATVHPARLAHHLRAEVLARGCTVYEDTPVLQIRETEGGLDLQTPSGNLKAKKVVLATNVALASLVSMRPYLTNFSSYACMSRVVPEALETHAWRGAAGAADLRMFLHYFRKVRESRVLMGAGSGPIGFGSNPRAQRLQGDRSSLQRPAAALHRLLPAYAKTDIECNWGWPIDVISDRLPYACRLKGKNIFVGGGFSGHGVNPTVIIGQCLASLVLGHEDEWSQSPFCNRTPPKLPPEPLRFLGGSAVRWGIMQCEDKDEGGRSPGLTARFCAALPRLTGMSIGLR